jgi:Rrf2 family nitric oxide-sensitive transcriptional repressor
MKLSLFTDYAMRVLLYLGAHPGRLCSIAEIAAAYGISRHHLMKVVNGLARRGHVETVRGRAGGVRLGRPPAEINVGAVIRQTEEGSALVECGECVIAPACGLTGALGEAMAAFFAVLDRYSLADVMARGGHIGRLLSAGTFAQGDAPAAR